jgi:4-amino-4-deoxy-L-arabinose transferase-like glycosyltransferase
LTTTGPCAILSACPDNKQGKAMKRTDYLLLLGYCFCVYGVALISGRPLTMHEAVLPECTREMHARGDWLVPTSGGRPWLHRPPLPHWTLLVLNAPFSDINKPWQVRLGPLLAGIIVTLTTAWLAQRWFGRAIGLLAGFILASSFQFVRYTWLAEEDMFLCAVIIGALFCFAKLEIPAPDEPDSKPRFTLLGWQSWTLFAFFMLLGLSNLAKGLIFGPLMILVPTAAYLLSSPGRQRLARYIWLWGWLAALLIGGAWPGWIYSRFPDVLEMWRYDYGGRLNGGYVGEPWWYYGCVLLWAMLPWTPCVFVGLALTGGQLRTSPPVRFLWCWAVGILVFFSIPDGKHHHYYIHSLPAWAMLAALGLRRWWQWVGGLGFPWRSPELVAGGASLFAVLALVLARPYLPAAGGLWPLLLVGAPLFIYLCCKALSVRQPWLAGSAGFAAFGIVFIGLHFLTARYLDESRDDAAFLREVPRLVEPDVPLVVNAQLRSCLEVNRILFDLPRGVRTVHNLTFLLDEERQQRRLYLLTQAADERYLRALGDVRTIGQSARSRREAKPGERLTLFEVNLAADLPRYSARVYIEQQQIKHRKPGPFLGGKQPREWLRWLARRESSDASTGSQTLFGNSRPRNSVSRPPPAPSP